ncbi:MAG TPA: hypothetical protein VK348_01040, partial [Planctomycetota bacterium]|nr:hypothetical protein [Planctomycetota bacterium]
VTGTGCSSAGNPPAIGLRQSPGFGRLHLSGAPPGALAHLLLAPAGQTTFGSFTLPLDLGSFGMPGCMLLVPPAVSIGTPTGTTGFDRGYAAFDLPLGLVPAGGFPVAAQWLVLDPATLGHALTPRHGFRVQ